mgnify:CR=1 FL=1
MEGYIKLSRRLLTSDIWYKPPLYLKVWIYLLCHATHKQYGNLQRGQLVTSISKIQAAMTYKEGCTNKRPTYDEIRRAIEFMRKPHGSPCGTPIDSPMESTTGTPIAEPMITTKRVTGGLLVTIVKYDEYQRDERERNEAVSDDGTPIDFGNGTPHGSSTGTPILIDNKKDNKNDNKKEGVTYSSLELGEVETSVPSSLPSSISNEIQTFEEYHHSKQLTESLQRYVIARKERGHPVAERDMPLLLEQVSELSQGNVEMAIAIVEQSIRRKWNQFWELSHRGGRKNELQGPPPPRIEDYPGDPDGFQEAVRRWQEQTPVPYSPNQRIKNRYAPEEPSEEERQRILQRMEEGKT